MRRLPSIPYILCKPKKRLYGTALSADPIISIQNGTFYRHHPSSTVSSEVNPPLFPDLTFNLSSAPDSQHWTIIGPSSSGKTTLLEILRGRHISIPAFARSFPYLSSPEIEAKDHRLRLTGRAIQYVGFGDAKSGPLPSGFAGAYLSARYESRREDTDFSLLQFLKGETRLNPPDEKEGKDTDDALLARVIEDLSLEKLLDMSVSNLSNGQTRRARIARALLGKPEVLLLDEPFMGLDPQTLVSLSQRLERLAKNALPRLIVALRPQDPVPQWMTHLLFLQKDCKVALQGKKEGVYERLHSILTNGKSNDHETAVDSEYRPHAAEIGYFLSPHGIQRLDSWQDLTPAASRLVKPHSRKVDERGRVIYESLTPQQKKEYDEAKADYDRGKRTKVVLKALGLWTRKGPKALEPAADDGSPPLADATPSEAIVEMKGIRVSYGSKTVLGAFHSRVGDEVKPGLHMTIRRGSRWGIFGPNGSGKTTLLSLLTSDHPQTYSLPITHFSRPRLHIPGSQPPLSLFELQQKLGHSSPEIHSFIPKNLSVRRTLEAAFAETFRGRPLLDHDRDLDIDSCLRWFEPELNPAYDVNKALSESWRSSTTDAKQREIGLNPGADVDWADTVTLGSLPLSSQRVVLFLRAIVKRPDLVILDEAFSGMDDFVRDKCLLFLEEGESTAIHPLVRSHADFLASIRSRPKGPLPPNLVYRLATERLAWANQRSGRRFFGLDKSQALVAVSHVREEVPGVVREWICLPDAEGNGLEKGGGGGIVRTGRFRARIDAYPDAWNEIWGINII